MPKEKTIAQRIVSARGDLSQAEAAKAWGLSKRTLQDWEQGRHAPAGLYLEKLERILRKAGV